MCEYVYTGPPTFKKSSEPVAATKPPPVIKKKVPLLQAVCGFVSLCDAVDAFATSPQ
jgi:hypothetical protein